MSPRRRSTRPVPHRGQLDATEQAILDALGRRVRILSESALGEEIAYDLGISPSTLSRIMSAETVASAPLVKRMADYWGVPVCELLRLPGQSAHPQGAARAFIRETGGDPRRAFDERPELQDLVARVLEIEHSVPEPGVVLRLLLALLDGLPGALQPPAKPSSPGQLSEPNGAGADE